MTRNFMRLAVAGLVIAFAGSAAAQSSKSSVQVGQTTLVTPRSADDAAEGWSDIMYANLHTAQDKDLIVGVSLEAGLFTTTTVRSKHGKEDTSWAEAMIEVRVLVDGARMAEPGVVIFARRYQELMAKFGGIVESCTDSNGDGTITFDGECLVTDEELRLVLETMAAHSFNFILPDLDSGDHFVQVQARITTDAASQTGESGAAAVLGKGSVTVEEVRMVQGLDVSI